MDNKNLLKFMAQRLNIHNEAVIRKAEEYIRRYQTQALVKTLNDQVRTVLCLDLASVYLGHAFDMETALLLSGLKRATYQKNLNILERVLGIDELLSIGALCVRLECTAIKEEAEEILMNYRKADGKTDDLDHPQYMAAATYLACRANKISVDKSKLIAFSNLKPSQWKELISTFESLGLGKSNSRSKSKHILEIDEDMIDIGNKEPSTKIKIDEIEDYEVWKNRILDEAHAALSKNK